MLDFSLMLRDKLEKSGKYRVVMTRTDDTFVELGERVRIARSRKAQLFISIHCDALARGEGDAQGAMIYTLVGHRLRTLPAARLADAENKADVISGVDLSSGTGRYQPNILIDLAQRETRNFSSHFARIMRSASSKNTTRLHKQPLKSAGFRVLEGAGRTPPFCSNWAGKSRIAATSST